MVSWLASACSTACRATPADAATWRVISATLDVSSSTAAATAVRSCDDLAAPCAVSCASTLTAAAAAIASAAVRIFIEASASVPITPPIDMPKSWVCCSSAAWRRSRAARAAVCSASSALALIMLSLNTWTAAAIAPISSPRPVPGMVTLRSLPASCRMASVMVRIGADMPRTTDAPMPRHRHATRPRMPRIQTRAERPSAAASLTARFAAPSFKPTRASNWS